MRDNSPMFQHWEEPTNGGSGPEGTAEGSHAVSAVPSGLDDLGTDQPNVETLGYCRMSLRDKVFVDYFKSIFRFESLGGIGPIGPEFCPSCCPPSELLDLE